MANVLFVLNSNDFERATRCFQFAKLAHGKGHQVNLFSSTAASTGPCVTVTAAAKPTPATVWATTCPT